jgi:hypothetical protein
MGLVAGLETTMKIKAIVFALTTIHVSDRCQLRPSESARQLAARAVETFRK